MNIRPTSDRLRETLFNVLCASEATLSGRIFLDLYAGTGAVGIEALSRGAATVYFVESSKQACDLILDNLRSLEVPPSSFEVLRSEIAPALHRLQGRSIQADIVFVDPPYRMESEYSATLGELAYSGLLSPRAIVIAEHLKKFEPPLKAGALRQFRTLNQGDSALTFWRSEGTATDRST